MRSLVWFLLLAWALALASYMYHINTHPDGTSWPDDDQGDLVSNIPMAEWEHILATPMPRTFEPRDSSSHDQLDRNHIDKVNTDEQTDSGKHVPNHQPSTSQGVFLADDANANADNDRRQIESDKRTVQDICGLTTYFNPLGYDSRRQNYRRFREASKRQGLRLATIELAFTSSHPLSSKHDEQVVHEAEEKKKHTNAHLTPTFDLKPTDSDLLIQRWTDEANTMWQKERLLNELLSQVGLQWPWCTKVVWLDQEVIFDNDEWVAHTSELLDQFVVVQPFANAIRLSQGVLPTQVDIDGAPRGCKSEGCIAPGIAFSVGRRGSSLGVLDDTSGHGYTGFSWAARRQVLDDIGFFDAAIMGGADTLMAHAFWGHFRLARGRLASAVQHTYQDEINNNSNNNKRNLKSSTANSVSPSARYKPAYYTKHFPPKLRTLETRFRAWATRVFAAVDGSVGYTPGTLLHLWHGQRADRQYDNRFKCLMNGRFDPEVDVVVGKQGVWEWNMQHDIPNMQKRSMHQCVKSLFADRAEDG